MTTDHAILLRDITTNMNSALAALGFGFIMGIFALLILVKAGVKPGAVSILTVVLGVGALCVCFAAWAQSWHFHFRLDWSVEVIRILGIVAACAIAGIILLRIVERAPPAALFACLAALSVCGLLGALAIWAPPHNLLLLIVALLIIAILAALMIIAWASVKMTADRPIIIQQAPDNPQIETAGRREINRGPLLALPRGARALQLYQQRNQSCQKR